MTHTKNNIHVYEEQQFLNEEQQTIQKILNDFKQPIPANYVKLKVEEGNYMGSTNPKWKDKPNHERYGFYLEEKEEEWVQIDIPHNLVEKLELEKGDDITYPLYLTIDISQKKLIRGAYTIDNEEEVFIDKPVSEKNVENELVKRLEELEKLREQVKELEDLKHEKNDLKGEVNNLKETIQEKDEENESLEELVLKGIRVKEELQKELQESKSPKRSWAGFYEWIMINAINFIPEIPNGDVFSAKKNAKGGVSWFKKIIKKPYNEIAEEDKTPMASFKVNEGAFFLDFVVSLKATIENNDEWQHLLPYSEEGMILDFIRRKEERENKDTPLLGYKKLFRYNYLSKDRPKNYAFLLQMLQDYRQATSS